MKARFWHNFHSKPFDENVQNMKTVGVHTPSKRISHLAWQLTPFPAPINCAGEPDLNQNGSLYSSKATHATYKHLIPN